MDRLPHDRAHLLVRAGSPALPTKLFQESIKRWLGAHVSDDSVKDVGSGEAVEAFAISKSKGYLCGRLPAEILVEFFFPSCDISWFVEDGGSVDEGDTVLSLTGPSESVLNCERVLLNVLSRMSGIATLTSEWAQNSGEIAIACTRKTAWGLLDKWAVHVGGGLTHRLSREDALMIKENDLSIIGPKDDLLGSISSAIASIDLDANAKFTVIEVQDSSQAISAASSWSEIQEPRGGTERLVILLDNMGPDECGKTEEKLSGAGLRDWCILEGSGGIRMEDLSEWVSFSRVDVISSSRINMGSVPLDFSMLIGGN